MDKVDKKPKPEARRRIYSKDKEKSRRHRQVRQKYEIVFFEPMKNDCFFNIMRIVKNILPLAWLVVNTHVLISKFFKNKFITDLRNSRKICWDQL